MNRSKEGALGVLIETRNSILESISDPRAAAMLTDDLLESVLDVAWRFQFDEDRSLFRIEIQKLLSDSIENMFLTEAAQ